MLPASDQTPFPHLAELDDRFRVAKIVRRSLARDRELVPELGALGASLIDGESAEVVAAFDRGLAFVVESVLENFPDNIFWDMDRLAAEMLERNDAARIGAMAQQLGRLQRGFGRHETISFRYAHDFLFGFDWARWVAREPDLRGSVSPFDDALLDYLEQRMGELRALVAANDTKYYQLDAAERWRNPFAFSRDPRDETLLLETLAVAGDVPVQTWAAAGAFDWRRCYGELRRKTAAALGIACEK